MFKYKKILMSAVISGILNTEITAATYADEVVAVTSREPQSSNENACNAKNNYKLQQPPDESKVLDSNRNVKNKPKPQKKKQSKPSKGQPAS